MELGDRLSALRLLLGNPFDEGTTAELGKLRDGGMIPASDFPGGDWGNWWDQFPAFLKEQPEPLLATAVGCSLGVTCKEAARCIARLAKMNKWEKRPELLELACRSVAVREALERMRGDSVGMQRVRCSTWSAAFGKSLDQALGLGKLLQTTPVLIRGETGTGKELVAKALSLTMPGNLDCATGTWTPACSESVHLAALPGTLVNDSLFGHEKAAFTGASSTFKGVMERCSEGVVFLDEVGELPVDTQVALLRVLQEKKVRRLGGKKDIDAAPRLISATNRDLESMVSDGEFRADLLFRLISVVVEIPPLRERRDDIKALVENELNEITLGLRGTVRDQVLDLLDGQAKDYDWPGNVRELSAAVRAIAFGLEPRLQKKSKPQPDEIPREVSSGEWPLDRVVQWYAGRVRDISPSDVEASARLGIHRQTLRKYLPKGGPVDGN
jgi:DNA-binding NtrC family response regulator